MPVARTANVHARVTPAAREEIDKLATDHATDQSTVVRAMLSVATQHPTEVAERLKILASA
jgi:hypothetical protein